MTAPSLTTLRACVLDKPLHKRQLCDVVRELISQQPFTADELRRMVQIKTGRVCSDAQLTARCRDLRKREYGAYPVKCERIPTVFGIRYQYSIPREKTVASIMAER